MAADPADSTAAFRHARRSIVWAAGAEIGQTGDRHFIAFLISFPAGIDKPDARVDLPELALAVDVLGVLGSIPQRGGFRDFARHLGPFDLPQLLVFGCQTLLTGRRYVG